MPRLHNALNGEELINAIIFDVRAAMQGDTRFEGHLTFPVVDYEVAITISAYPVSEENMTVKIEGTVTNEKILASLRTQNPAVAILKGSRKIGPEGQAPDEARVQTGQPVSVPTKTSAGVTFEIMEDAGKK